MIHRKALVVFGLLSSFGYSCSGVAIAHDDNGRATEITIAARQRFFGTENVDPKNGDVRSDRVIFSWLTNTTYAASFRGRIVLLDTYIHRLEVPPASGPDLRRSPFGADDLLALSPEAIFLGHGHPDHADNTAFVAKWLNIPVYATPETCDVLQSDVRRMAADPNVINGGTKLVPDASPIKCIGAVPRGSVPGTSIHVIDQLQPAAYVIAFKHIHSNAVPTDPKFWRGDTPLLATGDYDPRESAIYPPGTCVSPFVPPTTNEPPATVAQIGDGAIRGVLANGITGLSCSFSSGVPVTKPVPGQMNLATAPGGGIGGPYSIFYQFIVRDGSHFAVAWHDTTGPLIEGFGTDPGLTSAALGSPFNGGVSVQGNSSVGAHLFEIMDSLPATDVEFGAVTGFNQKTNGLRDPLLYIQHIRPQIYIPMHMTDTQLAGSSLQYKRTFLLTEEAAEGGSEVPGGVVYRPELRWQVDPNDYARPLIFDPADQRWSSAEKENRIREIMGEHY